MARLTRIDWPDFGMAEVPPEPGLAEYRGRLAALRAAAAARGLDALAVYGDREHAANLHWLTGFDPRFEEALLLVTADSAVLVAGNECLPYTGISPLVAAGDVTAQHCASFSLPSQPRGTIRVDQAIAAALPKGARVGAIGWKWFEADEAGDPDTTLDLPAFIADPLRAHAARVENATDLLMHPGHGLRARVDAAEIARLEFANQMAAAALRRMVFAFREGMTDFDAFQAAAVGGLPLGCHATFACGDRAAQGLSGPTGQILRRGSPISFNICHWRSNICRAGWLARDESDLPAAAQGHLADFVFPYMQAMQLWCSLMRPGVPGGEVWQAIQTVLPFPVFGVFLNPGHLIGVDEWMSSPIFRDSPLPPASGMAMQCDVIPSNPVHGSTRMEDGWVIADAGLRAALARDFPAVAARIDRRRAFLAQVIGLDCPDSLLPLADTCGIVAPWLLDPGLVVTLLD